MNKKVSFVCILLSVFAFACGNNEECKALDDALTHNQSLLDAARNKAAVHDRLSESLVKTEADVTAYLQELGLNWDEDKLNQEIIGRMKKVPGSKVVRRTRENTETSKQNLLRRSKTFWSVEFSAKDMGQGLQKSLIFTAENPIYVFDRLTLDAKGNRWLLELGRPVIDEVLNKPLPNKLPVLIDYADIPEKFGFCGANTKRGQLADISAEYASLKDKAEAISVILPKKATWKGLKRRANILETVERQTRSIIQRVFKSVTDLDLKLVGVAFEEPFVLIEIQGSEKTAKRLIRYLGSAGTGSQIMKAGKRRIRVLVPNQMIRSFQNKGGTGRLPVPSVPQKGHKGHNHGH